MCYVRRHIFYIYSYVYIIPIVNGYKIHVHISFQITLSGNSDSAQRGTLLGKRKRKYMYDKSSGMYVLGQTNGAC